MHLLLAKAASIDEAGNAAVDLGQSPAEVIALSFADQDLLGLASAWKRAGPRRPSMRLANLRDLRHPMSVDVYAESVLEKARVIIVRLLGGLDYWRYGMEELARICRHNKIALAAVPGDDRPDARLSELSTVTPGELALVSGWLSEGGPANLDELLAWAGDRVGRPQSWCRPRSVPAAGVFDPVKGGMVDLEAAMARLDPAAPLATIIFYRSLVLASDTAPITALQEALTVRGMAVLPIFVRSLKDAASSALVAKSLAVRRPEVILNVTAFSAATSQDGGNCLDIADAPVLQVVLSGSSAEAWAASPRGLSATDLAMQVVLPETDGRILTRAISFKGSAANELGLEFAPSIHVPQPDRVAFVAELAAAWARLARLPARERRLAIVLSDYPARGGRAGYAVGLDAPASVAAILQDLSAEGYAVTVPDSAELMRALADGPAEAVLSLDDYCGYLRAWRADAVARISAAWGPAESDPAFHQGAFRFRVVQAGNAVVVLQPDRGLGADRKAQYHDPDLPPRHAYVAFYAWLRSRIDALVHLGTHGTLEWLPGKAVALSESCYPELVLGAIPVIYPFIVNNPAEAAPAKHRIGAVTIGHLTPPLARAGLSGEAATLYGLIEEYGAAVNLDPRRAALLRTEILRTAKETGLLSECGLEADLEPAEALSKLDAWLCDLKDLQVRDGLHVFGRNPEDAARHRLAEALRAAGQESAIGSLDQCGSAESRALRAALAGRRVAAGPAGAPTRGRVDVLPTGRNLTSVDPRAVPTTTAWKLGRRAAEALLERYLQDHGCWPRSLIIDAWASPAMRTGGEDLAQALALIGAAPLWDNATGRVTGIEAWPQTVLGRPRVDVTLRISGLFRDVFPEQIRLFDLAVRTVAELDEPDDLNPLAAARRAAEDLARIFGAAPGSYGAGVSSLALDGEWSERGDLGQAYLDANGFAYGLAGEGRAATDAFRSRVAAADAAVHVQDDRERDLLDGDGVADFAGGLAAAAAAIGHEPALYHLDTSDTGATPCVRHLVEEVARVVRARAANPRWIEGQMRHGWRGAAELAQAVDALFAFAATLGSLRGDPFQILFDAYLGDDRVRDFLTQSNPQAAQAIARRFDDAITRGMWQPRRNSVAQHLSELTEAS
jgi:cobaltochelatase CobN